VEAGQVAVNAKMLSVMAKSFSSQDLYLTAPAEKKLVLADFASKMTIKSDDPQECPIGDDFFNRKEAAGFRVKMDSGDFRNLIRRVAFAAADEINRPILSSVKLLFEGGYLTAAALNGFYVAEWKVACASADSPFAILVPVIAIHQMLATLPFAVGREITMEFWEGLAVFRIEGYEFFTILVPGEYPKYWEIVKEPEKYQSVHLDRAELLAVVRKGLLFSRSRYSSVRPLYLKFGSDANISHLTMVTNSDDEDYSFEATLSANYPTELAGFLIALNPGYFSQIIEHVKSEQVEICIKKNYEPISIEDTEDGFNALLMPMHI